MSDQLNRIELELASLRAEVRQLRDVLVRGAGQSALGGADAIDADIAASRRDEDITPKKDENPVEVDPTA